MKITLDEAAKEKLSAYLDSNKQLLLTFEDGVGPYSQHAMIHMQTQFSINIISPEMEKADYDEKIPSNIGDFWIKGYSRKICRKKCESNLIHDSAHLACLAKAA